MIENPIISEQVNYQVLSKAILIIFLHAFNLRLRLIYN